MKCEIKSCYMKSIYSLGDNYGKNWIHLCGYHFLERSRQEEEEISKAGFKKVGKSKSGADIWIPKEMEEQDRIKKRMELK